MNSWQIIISPELPGSRNMEKDLELFQEHERGQGLSALRIYSWKPGCISLGYSQKIGEEIDLEKAVNLGWDVVKRPTGGGIVFHNEAEVAFSLVTSIDDPKLPKGLIPSYKMISQAVIAGLGRLGIEAEIRKSKAESRALNAGLCFSYPAEYEVVVNGKKIVGSAQKRGKRALLQQGSIFVRRTPPEAYSVLKRQCEEVDAVSVEEVLGREIGFHELKEALIDGYEKVFNIKF